MNAGSTMSGQDRVLVSVHLPPALLVRMAEAVTGSLMNRTDLIEAAISKYLGDDKVRPPVAMREKV